MIEIKFTYTNYKGEVAERTVRFQALEYLASPGFGYGAGWFLTGYDLDRKMSRSFALTNIVVPAGKYYYSLLEVKP